MKIKINSTFFNNDKILDLEISNIPYIIFLLMIKPYSKGRYSLSYDKRVTYGIRFNFTSSKDCYKIYNDIKDINNMKKLINLSKKLKKYSNV